MTQDRGWWQRGRGEGACVASQSIPLCPSAVTIRRIFNAAGGQCIEISARPLASVASDRAASLRASRSASRLGMCGIVPQRRKAETDRGRTRARDERGCSFATRAQGPTRISCRAAEHSVPQFLWRDVAAS